MSRTATILQLERISKGTGQGLQTVIFFKGCPMNCAWCPAPEDRLPSPEVIYLQELCRGCGKCIKACPNTGLTLDRDHKKPRILRDREKCKNCFSCVSVCPSRALQICGMESTADEVFQRILKNESSSALSGGTVYLRGGDIANYSGFAEELLKKCAEHQITSNAELTMYAPYEYIHPLLPYLDTITVELKMMMPELHRQWTGVDNRLILENLKKADSQCKKGAIHIRVPLIWNINDNYLNISKTMDFCRQLTNCCEVNFLPYHRQRQENYHRLNLSYALEELPTMTYHEAWKKVSFLCGNDWPFTIKVAGKTIYERSH